MYLNDIKQPPSKSNRIQTDYYIFTIYSIYSGYSVAASILSAALSNKHLAVP